MTKYTNGTADVTSTYGILASEVLRLLEEREQQGNFLGDVVVESQEFREMPFESINGYNGCSLLVLEELAAEWLLQKATPGNTEVVPLRPRHPTLPGGWESLDTYLSVPQPRYGETPNIVAL